MDEKQVVISNLIWRFFERTGAQLVAFFVSIIIARILDPSAYGTVALITVFIVILQVFVDSGLGNALIQKKDADDLDFSTVFYANVLFCTVLYIIIFFASPLIATFYENEELIPYIRVLGITVLISGVKNVQQAYVSRNMLFKKFFFSTIGGTLVAGIVGIIMALNNFGVWALVFQQVINLLIDTIILWITVKWRPKKKFSFIRLKTLFSYGWKLLVSSLIDTIYKELRQLIIGKVYTSSDLAYYNQGEKLPHLIVININASIDSVLLPIMSNVQDDRQHVKSMTRRSIIVSTYIMAPLMLGLAAVSKPLISVLLTEKWLFSVPYLRIFCITYMFYPIHTANLNAIKAMGRSDLFLKLEVLKVIVAMIALISTMWISVEAMAYSLLVVSLASQIINSWPNKKLLNYSYIEQLKDIFPSILLATIMAVCVYFVEKTGLTCYLILFLQIFIGIIIYIVGSYIIKLDGFNYLFEIAKRFLNK